MLLANFVKIGEIYANQMVVKVAISTINSNQLHHSDNNLYLGVTFLFWYTGYNM